MLQFPSENVPEAVQSGLTLYGPESLFEETAPPKLAVYDRDAIPVPSKVKVPTAVSGKK